MRRASLHATSGRGRSLTSVDEVFFGYGDGHGHGDGSGFGDGKSSGNTAGDGYGGDAMGHGDGLECGVATGDGSGRGITGVTIV